MENTDVSSASLIETRKSGTNVFDGNILHVFKDEIVLPNGEAASREFIRHVGAVAVIPVTDDLKVIMERQFRYPVNRVVFEIPAGKLDSKSEDRLEAAKCELAEETGITADEWIDLGRYVPAPAYSDEDISIYLAQGLHKGQQNLDSDEFLYVEEVPLRDLLEMVLDGRITDGKTQLAILKAAKKLGVL